MKEDDKNVINNKRQKQKNYVLMFLVIAIIALIYAVTIIKISH